MLASDARLPAWQRGVAALGIATSYALIALMLAGANARPHTHALHGLFTALQIGLALAMVISAFGLMAPQDRRAAAAGLGHMALMTMLPLLAWSVFPVALPSAPEDFRALILPMVSLMLMTQVVLKGTGWPR